MESRKDKRKRLLYYRAKYEQTGEKRYLEKYDALRAELDATDKRPEIRLGTDGLTDMQRKVRNAWNAHVAKHKTKPTYMMLVRETGVAYHSVYAILRKLMERNQLRNAPKAEPKPEPKPVEPSAAFLAGVLARIAEVQAKHGVADRGWDKYLYTHHRTWQTG